MKKTLLILFIILAGCVDGQIPSIGRERNEKCVDVSQFEVFQVFNGNALAFACKEKSYNDCAFGQTVFVPKKKGEDYYDNKRLKAPKGKCFVYDGVYKYTTKKDNLDKTVPVLETEYEYAPSSEKEALERLEEVREDSYENCMDAAAKELKNDKAKKMCKCLTDFIIDKAIEIHLDEDTREQLRNKDAFKKSLIPETEKKCGKLPKSMKG